MIIKNKAQRIKGYNTQLYIIHNQSNDNIFSLNVVFMDGYTEIGIGELEFDGYGLIPSTLRIDNYTSMCIAAILKDLPKTKIVMRVNSRIKLEYERAIVRFRSANKRSQIKIYRAIYSDYSEYNIRF